MDVNVKLDTVYTTATKPQSEIGTAAPAVAEAASGASADAKAAPKDVGAAVKLIDQYIKASERDLEYSIDQVRGVAVVKVVATETGEVIRQMPTEEALRLADSMTKSGSVLFDGKV
jgi:flagellar protein FlaG